MLMIRRRLTDLSRYVIDSAGVILNFRHQNGRWRRHGARARGRIAMRPDKTGPAQELLRRLRETQIASSNSGHDESRTAKQQSRGSREPSTAGLTRPLPNSRIGLKAFFRWHLPNNPKLTRRRSPP